MNPAGSQHAARRPDRYHVAVVVALAAATFVIVVAASLISAHRGYRPENPLDDRQWIALKQQLVERPGDPTLKTRLRAVDLELRRRYFRHQVFLNTGAWLLAAGGVVFLVAAKSALVFRRRLPMPSAAAVDMSPRSPQAAWARCAVAAVAILLAATVAAMLPAALSSRIADRQVGSRSGSAHASTTAVEQTGPDWPSTAEINANWPGFRGPRGTGLVAAPGPGGTLAVRWSVPVPVRGHGSPVVWDERIFLSGADETSRRACCFDAVSGRLLWTTTVPPIPRADDRPPTIIPDTGYAAATMCVDGRRACAFYANGDVAAFDFEGRVLWARNLGRPDNPYGHASSPVMWHDRVLIQFDQAHMDDGKSILYALDSATGRTVWQRKRPVSASWSSPVVDHAAGHVLTCADPWVIAYEIAGGSELWRAECLAGDVAPSPIVAAGLVIAVSPMDRVIALRPGGAAEIAEADFAWTSEVNAPEITSPVGDDRLLLILDGEGMLTCHDVASGAVRWEHDLDARFDCSPTLMGDTLLLISKEGVVRTAAVADGYHPLGDLALEEPVSTCPAVLADRVYVRGAGRLFALGPARAAEPGPAD